MIVRPPPFTGFSFSLQIDGIDAPMLRLDGGILRSKSQFGW
jgi:hypothetical protein